jgi:hypothetical protein
MNISSRIALLLCLVVLTSCTPTEYLKLDMDKKEKWKKGFEQGLRNQPYIVEYVPEGETVDNWSKMLSIQNFPMTILPKSSTPQSGMNDIKAKVESRCPAVIWNIIETGQSDILYEWRIENCPQEPSQHEISKIIDSKVNRFRIAYVSKVKMLPEAERKDWIERLRKAEIVAKE